MPRGRKSHSLLSIIQNLFQDYYNYAMDVFELAKLEAQLAVKSMIVIAVLLVLAFILVISAWVCFLAVIYWLLISYDFKPLSASLIVFASNFLFLLICAGCIMLAKRNLSFKSTRKHITTALVHGERSHE